MNFRPPANHHEPGELYQAVMGVTWSDTWWQNRALGRQNRQLPPPT